MKGFHEHHRQSKPRMIVFYVMLAALAITLISGLAWRQLFKKQDYLDQEEKQSLRRILQPAPRGEIYDRDGRLLVGNRPVFSATIYLGELRSEFRREYFKRVKATRKAGLRIDKDKLQAEARGKVLQRYIDPINKILGRNEKVNEKELKRHFHQRLLLPMTVIKDLSPEEYARLCEQLPVKSPIQVIVENARYYPYGKVAAHALGYVSQTDEVPDQDLPGEHLKTFTFKGKIGENGLEKSYNKSLQGLTGGEIWLVDLVGFQYESIAKEIPVKGQSLTSSIDLDIQVAAESVLEGKTGAVVAIEIKTGEVLAIASSPTFDLNDLSPYIPTAVFDDINQRGAWLNRATQGLYPPASPFKIITGIAGFRYDILYPGEIYTCGAGVQIGNRFFRENRATGWGDINFQKALAVSSNSYFYQLALKIGHEKIIEEAKRFQLDKPTGIDLPFENKGMFVPDEKWKMNRYGEGWRSGDTANLCFGQGYLLTTPLKMACFAAALARKETVIHPTLIHDSKNKGNHPESQPIGLSPEKYQEILNGMIQGATDGGGKRAEVDGLTLAAKTGTGQIRKNGKKAVTLWLVGFAPAEDPQIALAILIEGEDDTLWGSTAAAPLAKVILSAYQKKYLTQ